MKTDPIRPTSLTVTRRLPLADCSFTFRQSTFTVTEAGGMAEAANAVGMMIDAGSVAANLLGKY